MATSKRKSARPRRIVRQRARRFTIDASVFVNAFNPHEEGSGESLRLLSVVRERSDPVVVPTLLVPEIAAAVARATGDGSGALAFARATAGLPHLFFEALTPTIADQAAELAAVHRLRGADAIYAAVAHRHDATLVSRDAEQRRRAAAVVDCQTPEEALASIEEADADR